MLRGDEMAFHFMANFVPVALACGVQIAVRSSGDYSKESLEMGKSAVSFRELSYAIHFIAEQQ